MFSVVEKEMKWREANGLAPGFQSFERTKPLVAIGAQEPLGDQQKMADYFRKLLVALCLPSRPRLMLSWMESTALEGSILQYFTLNPKSLLYSNTLSTLT